MRGRCADFQIARTRQSAAAAEVCQQATQSHYPHLGLAVIGTADEKHQLRETKSGRVTTLQHRDSPRISSARGRTARQPYRILLKLGTDGFGVVGHTDLVGSGYPKANCLPSSASDGSVRGVEFRRRRGGIEACVGYR